MTRENFKGKLTATRNLRRARFYFRLFFIMTSLLIIAVWMDYWIRGELGAAKKYVEIARGKWEMAVLIAGGMIYILLLSLPFVSGAHWFSLNICPSCGEECSKFNTYIKNERKLVTKH